MKVLIAHNRYQQPGGEDQVVQAEAEMLRRYGHAVEQLAFSNDAIGSLSSQVSAALNSFFSRSSYARVLRAIHEFEPDVLHVHNFTPTLSPSVFFAGRRGRVPIVQTVHNYRLLCANGSLYRDGAPCERCLEKKSVLPAIAHGCYRGSRVGSAVLCGNTLLHQALGTWQHRIDRYIALTQFAAEKLAKERLPASRLCVKPNFVRDRGLGSGETRVALYVGRLSEEKGITTLLRADAVHRLALPVLIAGDGPLREQVESACARPGSRLKALGRLTSTEVIAQMKAAAVLLVPSSCYEGFPVTIAEAFSVGLPVIASRIGGLPEIVKDGECGMLHEAGDPSSLAGVLSRFASLSGDGVKSMRTAARERYDESFSEAVNYRQLTQIYADVIASAAEGRASVLAVPAHQE